MHELPDRMKRPGLNGASDRRVGQAVKTRSRPCNGDRTHLMATDAEAQSGYDRRSHPATGLRVALYSHDTMGIGHVRRNLLIAQALGQSPVPPTILILTGARQASVFPMPANTDILSLPALYKKQDGRYRPHYLSVPLVELITLRSRAIAGALTAFAPDVLIVDKVPRGAGGELDKALRAVRARYGTQCVLGLRDILDDPTAAKRDWASLGYDRAIRQHFDAVWIYGDPKVYDAVRQYDLSAEVAAKVHFTGYLDARQRLATAGGERADGGLVQPRPGRRLVLCLLGGGQDGAALAESFAAVSLPAATDGVILAGPFLPQETLQHLRRRAADNPQLSVLDFVPEPIELLKSADRIVAMGGYNTLCEIMALGKQALVVPRVRPRSEQLVRAQRLQQLGLIDVLLPDQLTSAALGDWIARDLPPPSSVRERVDLGGLARIPQLLQELCAEAKLRAEG